MLCNTSRERVECVGTFNFETEEVATCEFWHSWRVPSINSTGPNGCLEKVNVRQFKAQMGQPKSPSLRTTTKKITYEMSSSFPNPKLKSSKNRGVFGFQKV